MGTLWTGDEKHAIRTLISWENSTHIFSLKIKFFTFAHSLALLIWTGDEKHAEFFTFGLEADIRSYSQIFTH